MLHDLSSSSATCSIVTREMVYERTRRLASSSGRGPQDINQADYEQAKRELTGETDAERQASVLLALDPFRFQGAAALA
jgi:hypothetical protein